MVGAVSPIPVSWRRTLGLLCADAHHGNVGRQKVKGFELLQDCPAMCFASTFRSPNSATQGSACQDWEEEWSFQAKICPTRRNEEVLTVASSAFQFNSLIKKMARRRQIQCVGWGLLPSALHGATGRAPVCWNDNFVCDPAGNSERPLLPSP